MPLTRTVDIGNLLSRAFPLYGRPMSHPLKLQGDSGNLLGAWAVPELSDTHESNLNAGCISEHCDIHPDGQVERFGRPKPLDCEPKVLNFRETYYKTWNLWAILIENQHTGRQTMGTRWWIKWLFFGYPINWIEGFWTSQTPRSRKVLNFSSSWASYLPAKKIWVDSSTWASNSLMGQKIIFCPNLA